MLEAARVVGGIVFLFHAHDDRFAGVIVEERKAGRQHVVEVKVLVNTAVMDGESVADVAAADVEETHAGFQLFCDGEVLAFGGPADGLEPGTGIVGTGDGDTGDAGVVCHTGHPAVHYGEDADGISGIGAGFGPEKGPGGLWVFAAGGDENGEGRGKGGVQKGFDAHNVIGF
ncbi:hypothetical protein WJU22_15165 [Chitinophaga caseinilytica]|uniref:Uncharacterized protein n=1 Tax=Chitinophaga caseinilytica TaxID=2267521 RepID=A0ABZ2YY35_9BACT